MRRPDKPNVVAIIQARMGSTRLPGKVLKPIAGQPLLWHIIHRLRACKTIGRIAIATSTNPRDDAIVAFGREHDVTVVRGAEDDVLARFAIAANALGADVIVRVSSDAPFIDAGFVDHLVTSLVEGDGDYVLLEEGAPTAHEGVDPFSRRALQRLIDEAHKDPVAREHVTGYFKLHPEFVKIVHARDYPSLAQNGARLTIDTPDDLAFVEAVHARLNAQAGQASLADLLLLLEREPQLRRINAHVAQKRIDLRPALALIRCDGGGRFGYGHVKRMLSLASALRDEQGIGVAFALHGTADAEGPIASAGFEVARVVGALDARDLAKLVDLHRPDLLICDMREGANERELRALKTRVSLLAIVDDGSDRRLAADVAYYPPVPQAIALDWSGCGCVRRIGWEWTLLGMQKRTIAPPSPSAAKTVLVTMGGSDPVGLTLRMAHAFATHAPGVHANFVIGAGMKDAECIAREIRSMSSNFETTEGAENLSHAYANCGVAVCAFGVTASELAASGVPAIYISLTDDHAQSASAFEQAGMGISLGLHDRLENRDITSAVRSLLADFERCRAMQGAGLATIDGDGASRVAADLRRLLETRWNVRPTGIAAA